MADHVPASGTTVILISMKRKVDRILSCIVDSKWDKVTHWRSHPFITLPALELFAIAHTHLDIAMPMHFVCQFGSTLSTLSSVKSQSRLGNIIKEQIVTAEMDVSFSLKSYFNSPYVHLTNSFLEDPSI